MNEFLEVIGRLLPREQMREFEKFLKMAGMSMPPEYTAGVLIILSIVAALVSVFTFALFGEGYARAFGIWVDTVLPLFAEYSLGIGYLVLGLITAFSGAAIVLLVAYVMLMLSVDSRRKAVENILPDFLQLAAANVRAGMPVDQALWYAARPEFGLFSKEVELAAKRTYGGESFASSLDELAGRFNSKYLKRMVSLIKQGLASGGEMGSILEQTGQDIRNLQILYKEIAASLLTYIIFIIIASTLGSPFLYGVSYQLVSVLEHIFKQIPSIESAPGGLPTPVAPRVTSGDFLVFAIIACLMTSISASMIVAVVQTGNSRNGIKIAPIFVGVALAVLAVTVLLLKYWFSGIIG